MDAERKFNITEGVPLNSGATNIFLGKKSNKKSSEGAVIQLNTTERSADVGVHINTTLSIASSKKVKLLFILNFLLCIICMIISSVVAFYCWNEMISMRRQIDSIKEQVLIQNFRNNENPVQSPLVNLDKPQIKVIDSRQPRMEARTTDIVANGRTYFVEDLGEDMLLVDSKKKNIDTSAPSSKYPLSSKELLVVHFNGDLQETNLGLKGTVGPWLRDTTVSTENSEYKIALHTSSNYFTVHESGLYIVYAQMVYLTKKPNCYFIWARKPEERIPRLLATCSTGDDSSNRSLERSQISCSVQNVVRLYKGENVNIAQREPNRTVWLRPGYSYIGFVKLSS